MINQESGRRDRTQGLLAAALTHSARCPTAAIARYYVEDPYYEYKIDDNKCIGCAKCVEACLAFGNGSFYLQIRQDICINCNECSIAKACPSDAFSKKEGSDPYTYITGDAASAKP